MTTVLDVFFKTNRVSDHHLDSYHHCIDTRIPQIIRSLNPILVVKLDEQDPLRIKHKIEVTVGGPDGTNIYFDKPLARDSERLLFPNEARLFDQTYATNMFVDIDITYSSLETAPASNTFATVTTERIERVMIGLFPILLRSRLCALHGLPSEALTDAGECPFDAGGYFIIDGKEKVCVAQERTVTNHLFVSPAHDTNKYLYEAFIRCISEAGSIFPKTIRFFVSLNNTISINIPHINTDIPITMLFRALGVSSDHEMCKLICKTSSSLTEDEAIMDFLRPSFLECDGIFTQVAAATHLSKYVELKTTAHLYHLIHENLFPNIETRSLSVKAEYLAFLVASLIRSVITGDMSDRDNFVYKRVGVTGYLLADVFKDYYNEFRRSLRNTLDREYEARKWSQHADLSGHITRVNIGNFCDASIIRNGMIKSMKGWWGVDNVQGIVQDLNRISYLAYLSHLRRVSLPLKGNQVKLRRPHQLDASQYGMLCPSESPDGASIGLLKNFAVTCCVSSGVSTSILMAAMEPFENDLHFIANEKKSSRVATSTATKIFINNNWVGMCNAGATPHLVQWLRLLRRNSLIPPHISIAWHVLRERLDLFTESGRCLRPLLVVEERTRKLRLDLSAVKGTEDWNTWTIGATKREHATTYIDPFEHFNISDRAELGTLVELLTANQCAIEYIDVSETSACTIAMHPSDLDQTLTKYTHCEIHPSTMFSLFTATIPFANHNAAPRVVFSGSQGKQAVSVYTSTFNNRIDTVGYVLHYPQKPIVKTKYSDYFKTGYLPNGENLIVAIATYTGYNQEDSVIVNRSAIDRGMFNVSYFKNVTAEESQDADGGDMEIKFGRPSATGADGAPSSAYDALDANGMPMLNTRIHEGDVVFGRVGHDLQTHTTSDKSLRANRAVYGHVDRVVLYPSNDANNRRAKLRLRSVRRPVLGDKVASRHGQKGVVGMILNHEDMPFASSGIVPDMIINPHAFPSRMTVGHLMECVFAKACLLSGHMYDAMAFEQHDIKKACSQLGEHGLEEYGNEVLHNGRTGDMIECDIFMAPTYYQRLKHMVDDKINYRTQGAVISLTKQPAKGRATGGALRIGEMETNALIAHGSASFLKETFVNRADEYDFFIDREQGTVVARNPMQSRLVAPYAFKLMTQELQAMAIGTTMATSSSELGSRERADEE